MPLERVKKAKKKTIGTKQTLKAVQKGQAIAVFVARDADDRVIEPLLKLCEEKMLEVVTVESMKELGKSLQHRCGAASVAILAE